MLWVLLQAQPMAQVAGQQPAAAAAATAAPAQDLFPFIKAQQ